MLTNAQLLLQGVSQAILMLDRDGYISYANLATSFITGHSVKDLINQPLSIFYPTPEDKVKTEYELDQTLKKGKFVSEGWWVRKDGTSFWAELTITAIYEENQFIGYACSIIDNTSRKNNELELRQNEERFRLMVENVRDYAIFLMDTQGNIVTWNEGAKRIKGYSAGEIIGKHFSTFYTPEDLSDKKPERELKIAIATGKYEEEGWRVRKDGSRFWANVVITAVYNGEGRHMGYSKVTRDLTERKENEKALRDSYESYRRLANELKVTNTALSFANEELEQFTSIVSHDLQEPVRTIKSFLQLIDIKLSEGKSADLKTYISKSIQAANRMKELIQNLLQYSQLSRGEIIKDDVSVKEIFSEALQNLKTSVDASKASIDIDSKVESIYGDRVQLVQLIQNLVSNAIKFTVFSERPHIKIECDREDGHIKFSVSDNGIGIAEGDLNKVFEIFRRLNTKKDYPGTGIGLAICKKIVERHEGNIWPESRPGKGTTFHFTIKEESTKASMANETI